MNSEQARQLFLKLLSGEPMLPEEERNLLQVLESDAALRNELLDDAELDGWLRARGLSANDPEALPRSLSYRMEADRHETGFLRKLETRIKADRPRTRRAFRRPADAWSFGWVAALILLGIVGLVAVLNSGSPPPTNGKNRRIAEAPPQREQPVVEPRPREIEPKPPEVTRPDPRPVIEPVPEPKREQPPADVPKPPSPPNPPQKEEKPAPLQSPPRVTTPSVARIEKVEGDVTLVRASGSEPARADQGLLPGDGLEVGAKGSLAIVYPDKTRLQVGPETRIRELKVEGGKRLFVASGTVRAVVSKQPQDQPMVFPTPHGEATVLGTTLRIIVDPDPKKGMRLEVEEGKVRLKNLAGKPVDVATGQFAVAAAGVELVAKPFSAMEIAPRADGFPFDRTCPVIYDNDGARDVLADEYVMALASAGEISLRGIITTSAYPAAMTKEFIADRNELVSLARRSGMRNLPDPVVGCTRILRQPPSGRIEETRPILSQGSLLIVEQARRATPQRPLVVLSGGAWTTVADAYLLNNAIADRIVLVTTAKGTTRLELAGDTWAQYIVLEKLRLVQFTEGVATAAYSPADIGELPDTELRRKMVEHLGAQLSPGLLGDGPQCISLVRADFALESKRVSFSQWVPSELDPAVQVVGLKDDPKGRAWIVTRTSQEVANQEFLRALMNPAAWGPRPPK